ncbi:MAG: lactate dehydrogenase [Deltaproteobacteria bacterium]|nr:lactate dehydrogenase [Deltaproteobacteria bacterium]
MRILFAAPENAWGGFFGSIREELPEFAFEASGKFSVETLQGFDILIPTMSPVTKDLIDTADRLQLIQQCGSGLEGVDIDAARARNIWVANVPTDSSGNADSVAELGIYMMVGLSRDVRGMERSLRDRRMGEPRGRALSGRTVGLIGLGGIGRAMVQRLKSFGVHIIGVKQHDPAKAGKELGLDWVGGPEDLKKLLERSDFVVLALPVSPLSRRIINRETLAFMKRDAYLINLSRGGLVDRDALEEALAKGRIAGAGLDVYWEEPPDPADPIFKYNVLATPHIGGSTDVSMNGIVKAVAENIRRVERGLEPFHAKN